MSGFKIKSEDKSTPKQLTNNFTIDHILSRAGDSKNQRVTNNIDCNVIAKTLSWLQCTRYCPPKVQRIQKKGEPHRRRQLGKYPRIPFTSEQLTFLEDIFKNHPYLSSHEVSKLANTLKLADIRVKIWFQNRRARERREQNLATNSKQTPKNIEIHKDNMHNHDSNTLLKK